MFLKPGRGGWEAASRKLEDKVGRSGGNGSRGGAGEDEHLAGWRWRTRRRPTGARRRHLSRLGGRMRCGARGRGPSAHGEDIFQGRKEDEALSVPNFVALFMVPKTGALFASGLRLKGGPRGHPMGPLSDMEVASAASPNSASLGAADGAARTSSFLPLRLLWCSHRGAMWRLIGADPNACPTAIDLP